ncbi:unnamed protein product [Linum tenue]|uniref:Uncharacterized protein n=1 Tax=Linum tenue TaxID=586396 RepID=A0AAV0I8Q9_9ROSI|nr:unnamed protein product [Linum tenue]
MRIQRRRSGLPSPGRRRRV